jgi:hypothetical protein
MSVEVSPAKGVVVQMAVLGVMVIALSWVLAMVTVRSEAGFVLGIGVGLLVAAVWVRNQLREYPSETSGEKEDESDDKE